MLSWTLEIFDCEFKFGGAFVSEDTSGFKGKVFVDWLFYSVEYFKLALLFQILFISYYS